METAQLLLNHFYGVKDTWTRDERTDQEATCASSC